MTVVAMRKALPVVALAEGEREAHALATLRDKLLPTRVAGQLSIVQLPNRRGHE